jgi:hypothetical protein
MERKYSSGPRMSITSPLVSVIIPNYRSEQVLARALGSLLAQEWRSWEAIIVDDGSPDASWGTVHAYGWLDSRIRTIRQAHAGVCAARNLGIQNAEGEYLLFLDADDWMESDAIGSLVNACQVNDWVAAHGNLRYVTTDGAPTSLTGRCPQGCDLFQAISSSNVLAVPSSVLLRRSVLDGIGTFDTSLAHCGDWDLWARLARHAGHVGGIQQIVTNYRMSQGSLSRNPLTLLRDAATVLGRIHAPDTRVLRSKSDTAQGAPHSLLAMRVAYFTVYAAALAVITGKYDNVQRVLDTRANWPKLSATKVGQFVFFALCFSRCVGPEEVESFWGDVGYLAARLLADVTQRTQVPELASDAWLEIQACAGIDLPLSHDRIEHSDSSTTTPPAFVGAWETYADAALRALASGCA